MTHDNWDEYKRLVLNELERLNTGMKENIDKRRICSKEMDGRLDKLEQKVAVLTTKVWVGAGIISTIFTGVITAIIKHYGGG